jgi:hypothetical protein
VAGSAPFQAAGNTGHINTSGAGGRYLSDEFGRAGDEGVMAFTDFEIEMLQGLIEIHKENPDLLKRSNAQTLKRSNAQTLKLSNGLL